MHCHSQSVESLDPARRTLPLGCHLRNWVIDESDLVDPTKGLRTMTSSGPCNSVKNSQVRWSSFPFVFPTRRQIRTLPSIPPVEIISPSWLQAIDVTLSVCPVNLTTVSPSVISQMYPISSSPPDAASGSVGWQDTVNTEDLCSLKCWTELSSTIPVFADELPSISGRSPISSSSSIGSSPSCPSRRYSSRTSSSVMNSASPSSWICSWISTSWFWLFEVMSGGDIFDLGCV